MCLTAHSLLFSRLHKLRGFTNTMEDFYLEPERVHRVLDMIVDFKLEQVDELRRRFGDRIHGLFMTDDWGTQGGTFVGQKILGRVLRAPLPADIRRHPRLRLARVSSQLRPYQRFRAHVYRVGRGCVEHAADAELRPGGIRPAVPRQGLFCRHCRHPIDHAPRRSRRKFAAKHGGWSKIGARRRAG